MKTEPADLINAIAVEAYIVGAAFRRHGDALAKKAGQTQARWQVLRMASDGTLSVPQIARRIGVTRQNVQRIADALVRESLACFVLNPDHKSSSHVALTDRGRAVLAKITESTVGYRKGLASLLQGSDLGYVLASFRTLSAALAKLDGEPDLSSPNVRRLGQSKRLAG